MRLPLLCTKTAQANRYPEHLLNKWRTFVCIAQWPCQVKSSLENEEPFVEIAAYIEASTFDSLVHQPPT